MAKYYDKNYKILKRDAKIILKIWKRDIWEAKDINPQSVAYVQGEWVLRTQPPNFIFWFGAMEYDKLKTLFLREKILKVVQWTVEKLEKW